MQDLRWIFPSSNNGECCVDPVWFGFPSVCKLHHTTPPYHSTMLPPYCHHNTISPPYCHHTFTVLPYYTMVQRKPYNTAAPDHINAAAENVQGYTCWATKRQIILYKISIVPKGKMYKITSWDFLVSVIYILYSDVLVTHIVAFIPSRMSGDFLGVQCCSNIHENTVYLYTDGS